jgi:uncharacterized protein YabE (DUF348 family)
MALQKTVTLKTNFGTDAEFTNAYVRVESVKVEKNFAQALVQTHKEKDGQVLEQKGYSFEYKLDGLNPIAQTYIHLKSLSEFSDATDC